MKIQTKACSRCHEVKVLTAFSKVSSSSEKLRTACKVCQLARDNKWRAKNRVKVNAASRKWSKANPEARRAFQKRYREQHPQRVKDTFLKWMAKNRLAILARRALRRDAAKRRVILAYSPDGGCVRCRQHDIDVLCVDHINNDGYLHRRIRPSGTSFYTWLRQNNFPPGFQILCANCNLKKALVYRRSLVGKEKSGR